MVCGEAKHLLHGVSRADQASLNSEARPQDVEVWHVEVTTGDSKRVDDTLWCHDGKQQVPVRGEGCGNKELVDGLDLLHVLEGGALGRDELGGTELHGLFLLGLGAGENNNLAAHLGGELDGEVTKTADTNDTNTVSRLGAVVVESSEYGDTTAHQRCSVSVGDLIRKLEEEGLAPDTAVSETALVQVGVSKHLALRAVDVVSAKALLTVFAGAVSESPSDAVADLEVGGVGAESLDDTDTLVAENHALLAEVLVGATETGAGDLYVDLIALEFCGTGGLALGDGAAVRALEDGEGVGHF